MHSLLRRGHKSWQKNTHKRADYIKNYGLHLGPGHLVPGHLVPGHLVPGHFSFMQFHACYLGCVQKKSKITKKQGDFIKVILCTSEQICLIVIFCLQTLFAPVRHSPIYDLCISS